MSRFWSPIVHRLAPYTPGEQPALSAPIKLNTNENPYPPSPRVVEAIKRELDVAGDSLRRYPDPTARALRETLARYHGVDADQIFVGNGSDEVLAHAFNALLRHTAPILFPDITYSFYPTYARLYEVAFDAIPLTEDLRVTIDDYRRPNGGVLFPNPNAPTGRVLGLEDIERLLAFNRDSAVIVDEAYIDFGGESAIPLIRRHPQLLVVRTLSKGRSLAGARVGYAVGDVALIEGLNRVKDSFNSYPLDRLAQAAAVAAIEDEAWFRKTRDAVIASRSRLSAALAGLGFKVIPSAANFVFATHPGHDAATLARSLREREIFVRHFALPRIEQFLRISVGTDQECDALLQALGELVSAVSA